MKAEPSQIFAIELQVWVTTEWNWAGSSQVDDSVSSLSLRKTNVVASLLARGLCLFLISLLLNPALEFETFLTAQFQ